ncbi:MAG: GerMN domain-containing protein [Desulfitobacteriaceae bacterium]|nr:GerMN domain-containing protein [Desulfitobacteriaceae bacterium]MDI6879571.1 GerMN domain-containing protein [Desulfitobacteriaceae bacterium]MDI6913244.1 GerMN domain-containing protein [Desulfitobacteriaceae bacterium]
MLDRVPNSLYRGLVTLLGLVVILALIPGCGALDTMLQKDGNAKSVLGEWIGNTSKSSSPQGQNPTGESKTIVLYFADSTGKYLIAEERTIPKTLSLARETVTQWLRGPAVKGTSVQSAVSPSTTLLDIAVKDGIATVDLSKDFSQPYAKVSPEVTLYGLVNTLTQFPTIKEVKFRVEGKPLQKLGAVDAGNLTYKGGLIKSGSPTTAQPKSPSASDTTGTTTGGNPVPASPSSINLFSFPVSTT